VGFVLLRRNSNQDMIAFADASSAFKLIYYPAYYEIANLFINMYVTRCFCFYFVMEAVKMMQFGFKCVIPAVLPKTFGLHTTKEQWELILSFSM